MNEFNTFKFTELGLPKRIPPRPLDLRQPTYEDEFDYDTYIYDVLYSNNKIIILSPFLTQEQIDHILLNIFIDNKPIQNYSYIVYKTNRTVKIIIDVKSKKIHSSTYIFNRKINFKNDLYKYVNTSKVLYTLQKNNNISWIIDWIRFYDKIHKPTLIIIYDNNSTEYTINELNKELKKVTNKVIVKSFPFKYGPGAFNGSAWDSDYCQYAAFEHIRYSLNNNAFFLNVDIDEILISKNNLTIYDYIEKTDYNAILFKGKWIFSDKNEKKENFKSDFSQHVIVEKELKCSPKYIVNLNKINDNVFLGVHDVFFEKNKIITDDYFYLHCRHINNNWKYNRSNTVNFNDNYEKQYFLRNFYE